MKIKIGKLYSVSKSVMDTIYADPRIDNFVNAYPASNTSRQFSEDEKSKLFLYKSLEVNSIVMAVGKPVPYDGHKRNSHRIFVKILHKQNLCWIALKHLQEIKSTT